MRYADILILLRILKGTVNINLIGLGKCEMLVLLLDFSPEIPVERATSFQFFRHLQRRV